MKRGFTLLKGHKRNYIFLTGPVRKIFSNGAGFTLIELIVVIIISAILAGIVIPMFTKAIKRTEFKEVKTISDLTVTAARYYDFKYGINSLNVEVAYPQGNRWGDLNVEYPQDAMCTYEIKDSLPNVGIGGNRGLQVGYDGMWLYRYDFEWESGDGWDQGDIDEGHSDSEYIERLDLPGV